MLAKITTLLLLTSVLAAAPWKPNLEDDYLPEDDVSYKTGKENTSVFNNKYELEYNDFKAFTAPSLYGEPDQSISYQYVITIDDGPTKYTPQILELLEEHSDWHLEKYGTKIKATFFHIGELVEKKMEISQSVLEHGHTLSGHTWTHPFGNKISAKQFRAELIKSQRLIDKVYDLAFMKQDITYFRFPYADYGKPRSRDYHHFNELRSISNELYNRNCIHFAFWDTDPGDWMYGITPERIFQNFLAKHHGGTYWDRKYRNRPPQLIEIPQDEATFGGVLLMHETQSKSVEFLRKLLVYARDHNIEFVPLESVEEYNYGTRCR